MADERGWYANVRGEQRGPMSSEDLKTIASSGTIDRASLVWCDGLANWVQAGTVKGLFSGPPPVRETIKHYEIEIDGESVKRNTRVIRIAAWQGTFITVVGFVICILTKGLFSLLGLLLIPVAFAAFFAHVLLRGFKTMRYRVENDTLQVSCKGFNQSIPLHSITDVQVLNVNGRISLLVQAGPLGVSRLTDVLDPNAAAKVLLSGRR